MPSLPAAQVVARLAFASPDTAVADVGATGAGRAPSKQWAPAASDELRRRIREGDSVLVVAEDENGVLCSGEHNPVGDVTEIVGVGTLPGRVGGRAWGRRHRHAGRRCHRRGVEVIFLTADTDEVARVYERVGFKRIGTACRLPAG